MVRRRVGSLYTDLIGQLIELGETHLTVRTPRGTVRVPLDEVHRAKRVPDIRGVEEAAADAMPPVVLERLGEWRLRAAGGFTSRANSALPLGDPGMPISDAIEAVVDFYRRHQLPPRIDVPLPFSRLVARELDARGWVRVEPEIILVRVIDLPDLIAATSQSWAARPRLAGEQAPLGRAWPSSDQFTLMREPSEEMLTMIFESKKRPITQAALHVLTAVPSVIFCGYRENELLSMARGTVTRGWLGLMLIHTVPAAQRRGLARAAIGALARWAEREGARRAYLQVEDTNTGAVALYDSLGFAPHHHYVRYRAR